MFVHGIILLKGFMNMLLEVLYPFNKFSCMICLNLSVEKYIDEDALGRAISMGANGWNPENT
jgi:hypothetical protein